MVDVVRSWKDPFYRMRTGSEMAENPVGEVLLDEELDDVIGGAHKADSGGGGGSGESSWDGPRYC
ncbi:mersacidin/lichenicidin family type 2 lantibiotic [Micromonospora sp. WMMD1102]|uniref:mersacidin/lichenicidin family type 2 lantibiotic n=1 Tax=Micromonospora sp. WMMD1102 TaxID=3016105 RepID=UPI00241570A0|nr:mersacidin/lichenicidin family type 2 lantibiotic [Micromonospora sp. WMMD1102]MDG4791771.1 mersacidin/lichenicidin family type 2 lantibiotic [Micromonospora sp. WMMD1102]